MVDSVEDSGAVLAPGIERLYLSGALLSRDFRNHRSRARIIIAEPVRVDRDRNGGRLVTKMSRDFGKGSTSFKQWGGV